MNESEPGNSVYFRVGIWYNQDQDSIHPRRMKCPGSIQPCAPMRIRSTDIQTCLGHLLDSCTKIALLHRGMDLPI